MLLGEILVNRGAINLNQLEEALKLQSTEKRPLGQLLLENKLISPSQLEWALKEQYWRANGYWVLVENPMSWRVGRGIEPFPGWGPYPGSKLIFSLYFSINMG